MTPFYWIRENKTNKKNIETSVLNELYESQTTLKELKYTFQCDKKLYKNDNNVIKIRNINDKQAERFIIEAININMENILTIAQRLFLESKHNLVDRLEEEKQLIIKELKLIEDKHKGIIK
jgi:hypothetical protein